MARAHGLHGLALSAVGRAPQCPIVTRADRVAAIPEFRGDAAVAGILDHACFFAVLDFPADFGGELEMVAPVVDGPRPICLHEDGVVSVGDQVPVVPLAWVEADIGHADDRKAIPAFGAHGAAGARLANRGSSLAIAQVASEEAVGDDWSALRGDALIIVGKCAEAGAVSEARVG